jgi:hypothetical protein
MTESALIYFAQRRAHAPLGASAEVSHGVEVVITGNHVNRTAPSGCVARLVSHGDFIGVRIHPGSLLAKLLHIARS